ncbi:MAG: LacI family DNA-binding transcriptional regulator [bacterium]|nr:LacI family DNA-binding transcriptional regulator [Candidatus Sumerlaeota bacterium]
MTRKVSDVAKHAGVSVATVSRVLNNIQHPVSEKTRKRVLKAAAELNYQPNIHAKSLATGRNFTLELFLDLSFDSTGETGVGTFLQQVLYGIEEESAVRGYRIVLDINRNVNSSKKEYFTGIFPIAGAVVLAPRANNPIIPELVRRHIPLMIIGSSEYRDQNYVDMDNITGALKATEHLINAGHKDIMCLGGPTNFGPSLDRMTGFRRAMRDHGLNYGSNRCVTMGAWNWDNGFRMMWDILRNRQPRPTAIFASNDMLAIGAIRAIKSAGLTVPGDIAVVGFDDLPSAQLISPALTTIRQPFYDLAREAARVLIERIDASHDADARPETAPYQDTFVPDLIVRDSCGVSLNANINASPDLEAV